jgi:branched-chain amino acid transport system ATP-binding protein
MTAAAQETLLSTRDLSVRFGGLKAVDGVTLDVKRGGVTSVIGPNGAGKSTLFNLISGAVKPASGQVFLDGAEVTGLPPHRLRAKGLSRSFQITNLFPGSTVYENLRLAAQILEPQYRGVMPTRRSRQALRKVEDLIERFGLSEKAAQRAGELSHGQQRRLEIAVALASEPDILLLDEPTQGMSHGDTEDTKALIMALSNNLTILLIEHDINLVMELSRWVFVLHQGRKIAEGQPADVRANRDVQIAYFGEH